MFDLCFKHHGPVTLELCCTGVQRLRVRTRSASLLPSKLDVSGERLSHDVQRAFVGCCVNPCNHGAPEAECILLESYGHGAKNPVGNVVISTLPYSMITASSNPEDPQPLKALPSMQKALS